MCGILAVLGHAPQERVKQVIDRLAHRGPDGEGMTGFPGTALAHRRLAIMDPEAGRQPLFNEDKTLAVTFNGEIYNHDQLRNSLSDRHRFGTRSDTEVLPHLYEEHGMKGLQGLEGMYAFVLAGKDKFVAARDPVGIKPLYIMEEAEATWFASEIKALYHAGTGEIREFPPGYWYDSKQGWSSFSQPGPNGARIMDVEKALPLIRDELARAVERRLMSDVPLGAFLSGGLDSSLIATIMMRTRLEKLHTGGKLHTFSVGMPGSPDLARAGEVAEAIGSMHTMEMLSERAILDCLPHIIDSLESYDRDLVRSAIPCYFVSRLARRKVKVVLTGEGADELFAGYSYLKDYRDPGELQTEMVRLVKGLHNMNLQRVDRLTMAHGLEARVPFLDMKVIELALSIDPQLKLYGPGRREKWLLRSAFSGMLPDNILWRTKEQFDEGSGVAALMPHLSAGRVRFEEEQARAEAAGLPPLRDMEEAWYFKLFRERYDPARVRQTLGRWEPPQAVNSN